MKQKNILLVALFLLMGAACQDPYNDLEGSGTDYVDNDSEHPPTDLDLWLHNTFTLPYNIEVKYRWDNSELNPYKTLVPPAIDKVQGVMEVVKKVWIDTYSDVAGTDFIATYCPKQFLLVGSANYNFDGTFTIGTAEGGRKVVLYVVNQFDPVNRESVKALIHTVEHEFAHILHQKVAYPAEFKEISGGAYTANWSSVSMEEARARGFITSYAMASPHEDFVEMIAMMLVEGKQGYERILACETNGNARAILKQKEQRVVEYFREAYDVDFYELQTRVQSAMEEIAPAPPIEELPPVFDTWGFGKAYSSIVFDLNFMTLPQNLLSAWATDHNSLTKHNLGLHTYFRLYFQAEDRMHLQLYYYEDTSAGRIFHEANFIFEVFPPEDNKLFIWFYDRDENARRMQEDYGAYRLLSLIADHLYEVDWERTSCPGSNVIGFYPVEQPNLGAFYGLLVE